MGEMITLAIRFDDPSPTSNRPVEEVFLEALARWRLRATLAVVPHRVVGGRVLRYDRERAAHILPAIRDGLVEVALHGHSHRERSRTPTGSPSEFWGLDVALQTSLLVEGLGVLQNTFGDIVSGFVPPWTTFDADTLTAVARTGLRYVSAGWEGPKGLMLLPGTCQLADIRRAVDEARRFPRVHCVVVAVVHHYDFMESGEPNARLSDDRLEMLFQWIAAQGDIRAETLSEVANRLTPRSTLRAIGMRRLRDRMPARFRSLLPEQSMVFGPLWHILAPHP